jgi:hypothetical protein
MADDATTILDEPGIDRADILGFSRGSVTAQDWRSDVANGSKASCPCGRSARAIGTSTAAVRPIPPVASSAHVRRMAPFAHSSNCSS